MTLKDTNLSFCRSMDAEPRKLRAILDVKTGGIYILETTKEFAEGMGMAIKEVNADEDGD